MVVTTNQYYENIVSNKNEYVLKIKIFDLIKGLEYQHILLF